MLYYILHSDFNVTLSEAKGLTSYDRFFATLRMTFWAKPRRNIIEKALLAENSKSQSQNSSRWPELHPQP